MALIFLFKCTLKCRLQFVPIWTSLKFCRLVMGQVNPHATEVIVWFISFINIQCCSSQPHNQIMTCEGIHSKSFKCFPNDKSCSWVVSDCFKLKEFADNNFKFDENGIQLSKRIDKMVGKGEIAHYELFLLFSQCFQTTCEQTRKDQGLFGKGLSLKTIFEKEKCLSPFLKC